MKILLIDPPFYRFIDYYNRFFPLGLSYLAAVLQREEYEVMIYDADCNINPSKMDFTRLEDDYPIYLKSLQDDDHLIWQELREVFHNFSPDIVGITVWTTFAASAFKIASIIKKMNKDMPVIMGGPHISIKYDEVLKICPDVDILVRGEGEETFLEMVRTMKGKVDVKFEVKELKDICGISYRKNGKIFHNPPRNFIKGLDTIPFPARDLLLNNASYNSEDMGLLMTSRGCPYNCTYCATSIWERKTRYRSPDNVIEEIKFVMDTYGTTQFTFKDDSFTVNRRRVHEFCDRLIKENIKIKWDCNTRVDLVDEELLRKMKKSGCNSIKVGIETGSGKILKLINKKITFDQCRRTAKLFKKAGIHWTGYFMAGVPSETKEDIYSTLKFMRELKPDYASFCTYEPFPGTELFKIGLEKGLTKSGQTLEDFYNTSPKYYYVKDNKRRIDTMSNEDFKKLEDEIKTAFNKYNRGFVRLFSRLIARSGVYFNEPKILLADIKKFLAWF